MIDSSRDLSSEIYCLEKIINEIKKVKGITQEDIKNLDLALSILERLKGNPQSPETSLEVLISFSIYDGGRAIDLVISENILEIVVSDKVDFGMGSDHALVYSFSTEFDEPPSIDDDRVELLKIIGDLYASDVKNLNIES